MSTRVGAGGCLVIVAAGCEVWFRRPTAGPGGGTPGFSGSGTLQVSEEVATVTTAVTPGARVQSETETGQGVVVPSITGSGESGNRQTWVKVVVPPPGRTQPLRPLLGVFSPPPHPVYLSTPLPQGSSPVTCTFPDHPTGTNPVTSLSFHRSHQQHHPFSPGVPSGHSLTHWGRDWGTSTTVAAGGVLGGKGRERQELGQQGTEKRLGSGQGAHTVGRRGVAIGVETVLHAEVGRPLGADVPTIAADVTRGAADPLTAHPYRPWAQDQTETGQYREESRRKTSDRPNPSISTTVAQVEPGTVNRPSSSLLSLFLPTYLRVSRVHRNWRVEVYPCVTRTIGGRGSGSRSSVREG